MTSFISPYNKKGDTRNSLPSKQPAAWDPLSLGSSARSGKALNVADSMQRPIADISLTPPRTSASMAMESFPWPVLRIDPELRYLEGNSRATALTVSSGPVAGKSLAEIGWPSAVCSELAHVVNSMEAVTTSRTLHLVWPTDTSQEIGFDADLLPEMDPHGALSSVLIMMRTANERKRSTAELHESFLQWASHELRSPLNSIQSWTHILETYAGVSSQSGMAERALTGIRNGVAQQLRLIEEMEDLSRIVEGNLPMNLQSFSLEQRVHFAIDSVRDLATNKRLEIQTAPIHGEDFMEGDPLRVQHCLKLLLLHATYNADPHTTLLIEVCTTDGRIEFRVRYTSPGKDSSRVAPAFGNVSRQNINILLANCLAALLNAELTGKQEETGKVTHTLSFPFQLRRQ